MIKISEVLAEASEEERRRWVKQLKTTGNGKEVDIGATPSTRRGRAGQDHEGKRK